MRHRLSFPQHFIVAISRRYKYGQMRQNTNRNFHITAISLCTCEVNGNAYRLGAVGLLLLQDVVRRAKHHHIGEVVAQPQPPAQKRCMLGGREVIKLIPICEQAHFASIYILIQKPHQNPAIFLQDIQRPFNDTENCETLKT